MNFFLTESWLSGLLYTEIFISKGELGWGVGVGGGPDVTIDRWKQPISAFSQEAALVMIWW